MAHGILLGVDWSAISAVASSFAFVVAMGVFLLQLRDRRRHQATLVSAWATRVDTSPTATDCTVHYVFANNSTEPIWEAEAYLSLSNRDGGFCPLGEQEELGLVPPDRRREMSLWCAIPDGVEEQLKVDRVAPENLPRISVQFLDAGGRRWRRTSNGSLLPLGVGRPPSFVTRIRLRIHGTSWPKGQDWL